jgi:hypothetical protein
MGQCPQDRGGRHRWQIGGLRARADAATGQAGAAGTGLVIFILPLVNKDGENKFHLKIPHLLKANQLLCD